MGDGGWGSGVVGLLGSLGSSGLFVFNIGFDDRGWQQENE